MLFCGRCLVIVIALQAPLWAADNARHIDLDSGLITVATLHQNWTDSESNQFYNAAQGSQLLPYDWFLHLEQADNDQPFRDPKHLRALGYITRSLSSTRYQ
jgi:hypothetical protein